MILLLKKVTVRKAKALQTTQKEQKQIRCTEKAEVKDSVKATAEG